MVTKTDCQKCGSSQTLITPVGMIDYFNFRVKIKCFTCGYTKYMTMPIPHQNTWDTAEQNKDEIEREKDERDN